MGGIEYFAYGSNLDPEQMRARCPSARALSRARLPHYRLEFSHFSARWQGGAADILPSYGDAVWGIVYWLEAADLPRLDRYEGAYERILLRVEDARGLHLPVLSYTVRRKGSFHPTPEYVAKMLRWAELWHFPPSYLARLRQEPRARQAG
jgi:hypothetical protein